MVSAMSLNINDYVVSHCVRVSAGACHPLYHLGSFNCTATMSFRCHIIYSAKLDFRSKVLMGAVCNLVLWVDTMLWRKREKAWADQVEIITKLEIALYPWHGRHYSIMAMLLSAASVCGLATSTLVVEMYCSYSAFICMYSQSMCVQNIAKV